MSDKSWTRPFPPNKHLHYSPLMRIQTVEDSDGKKYSVYVQNEEMSCGPASAAMLISIYKGRSASADGSESRLKAAAANFPGSLVESDKLWAAGKPEFGSMFSNMESLLRSESIMTKSIIGINARIDPGMLAKPAMVLWGWYPQGLSGERKGGHFTVAAGVSKTGKITILDPWDGSLSEVYPGQSYHRTGICDGVIYTS